MAYKRLRVKLTTNKVSKLDRYPIPRIEDLFSKWSGGQCFTKLDLSQAYQQICLEEDSKKYVVVNTHKGLYQYNRLPYGISSAPGIFQRTHRLIIALFDWGRKWPPLEMIIYTSNFTAQTTMYVEFYNCLVF